MKDTLDKIWGIGWILAMLCLLPVVIYAQLSNTKQLSIEYHSGDWAMTCPLIIAILTAIYILAYTIGSLALLTRLSIWIYEKIKRNII